MAYERLSPYYRHNSGRPENDPVALIRMVLLQHPFGIPSLRQTHREIQVNLAYRRFLGYGLLAEISHLATVSYAFCRRFPDKPSGGIFGHIFNKVRNHRMVDPRTIFMDGVARDKVYDTATGVRFVTMETPWIAKKAVSGTSRMRRKNPPCALYTPRRLGRRHAMGQA